jgi:hypothetical protein
LFSPLPSNQLSESLPIPDFSPADGEFVIDGWLQQQHKL